MSKDNFVHAVYESWQLKWIYGTAQQEVVTWLSALYYINQKDAI